MSASNTKILGNDYSLLTKTVIQPPSVLFPGRRKDAKVFLREFTRELRRETTPAAKVLVLIIAAVVVSSLAYGVHAGLMNYKNQKQETIAQTEALTKRIDEQEKLLAQLREQSSKQGTRLTDPAPAAAHVNEPVTSPSLPTRLWSSYSKGTCLIAGSYILIDPASGRPLRYPDVELSPEERLLTSGTQVPLTTEGNGTIFEAEFSGTGFHVGNGYVITNRHIATGPWAADQRAQFIIASTKAEPRMHKLLAFFPGQPHPIPLKFTRASKNDDLAVCNLKTTPKDLPALPLDQESSAIQVGKTVVMIGYPTGPNRLLALLPEAEGLAVQEEYGSSLVPLLDQLAKRKLIKPLTTQGHITDLYRSRIVFDASSTDGSSGTPMFGESGKVIGVTFAVLVDDSASNFAISINGVIAQLQLAGWKAQ